MRTGSINTNSRFGYSNRYYNISRESQSQRLEEQKKRRNKELALTGLGLAALGIIAFICNKTSAGRKLLNEAAENAAPKDKSGWFSNLLNRFKKGTQQGAAEATQETAEKTGWLKNFLNRFRKNAAQGAEATQETSGKIKFKDRIRNRFGDTFERSSSEASSNNQVKEKGLFEKLKEKLSRKNKPLDPNRKLTQDEIDELVESTKKSQDILGETQDEIDKLVLQEQNRLANNVPTTVPAPSAPTVSIAPTVAPAPSTPPAPFVINDDVVPIGPFPIDESSLDSAQQAYNKVMLEAQETLNNERLIRQQAQEATRQALEGKEILSQSEIDAIVNRETKLLKHQQLVEEAQRRGDGFTPWFPKETYTRQELDWQRFGEDYKKEYINWEKTSAQVEQQYAFEAMDKAALDSAHLKALQAADEATLEAQRGKNILSQSEIDELIAKEQSKFTQGEIQEALNNRLVLPDELSGYSPEEIEEMLARSADQTKTLQENLEALAQLARRNADTAQRAGDAADEALATALRKQQELLGEAGLSAGSVRPESDKNVRKAADDIMNTLHQIKLGGKINKAQFIEELFSSEYVTKYCQPHPYFVEEFEKLKPETIAAVTRSGFEEVLINVKDERSAQEIIKALQEFQKKIPARHLKKYAYNAHNMNNKAYHKVVDAINEIIEMSR